MTSDAQIVIAVKSDGKGARVIKRDLDSIAQSGDKATGSSKRLERQTQSTTRATQALSRAMGVLMTYFGAQQLIRFSDNITTLETQLRNVTKGTADYTQKFDALFKVAQRTGDRFSDITDTFVRLNTSLPDTIRYTTDLTKVTELLARGMAASGANAQTASAVMTQLTQGLSSNFANASQELNSLIEGTPLLARLISEQLGGKAASDMKRLAEAGELTTEAFLKAILGIEGALEKFAIPPTISRSWNRITNEMLRLAAGSDSVEEAQLRVAEALSTVADNLVNVLKTATTLAATTIPALTVAIGRGLVGAVGALSIAVRANPLFFGASILSGAIAAVIQFKDEIKLTKDGVVTIGDVFKVVFDDIKLAITTTITRLEELFRPTLQFLDDVANHPAIQRLFGGMDIQGRIREQALIRNGTRASEARLRDLRDQSLNPLFRAVKDGSIGDFNSLFGLGKPKPKSTEGPTEDEIKEAEKAYKKLTDAIKNSRTEEEKLLDKIKELEGMRGIVKTAEDAKGVETAISRARGELDELRIEAERNGPVAKAFESLANQIDDGFRDAFRNAFTQSDGGWKALLDGWKATFKTFLADLAYMALARPIVLSLAGGVGGAIGVSSGAQASILSGISGGSGGGFSLGSLSQGFSSINGLLNGTGGAGFINSIGQYLGFSQGLAPGVFGPAAPGSIFGTTTLGGALSGGAIGGLAANLLGLGSGNMVVDTGLGLAGTAIGSLFGGPIGAGVGSFLGTALGGLLGGGSTPSNAADIAFNVSNGQLVTGGRTSDEASAERLDQIGKAGSSITDAINGLVAAVGGTLESAPKFRVGSTRREPGNVSISGMRGSGQSGEFVFNSFEKGVDFALTSVLARADLSGVSDEFEKAFKDIFAKGGSFQERAAEVLEISQIFQLIESFETVGEAVKPLAAILDELDAQFANLKNRALDLGLPVDKLTESFEKQRQSLISGALQPLQQFLDSQALSGDSTMSAVERLGLARGVFDQNLGAIQSGDFSNLGALTNQASQLLAIGRDVFASGEGFSALESFVRQSITGVAGDLGAPGGLNDSIAREMTLSNAEQTSILQQMNAEIQALAEENRKLRKSMERVGNAVVQMTS